MGEFRFVVRKQRKQSRSWWAQVERLLCSKKKNKETQRDAYNNIDGEGLVLKDPTINRRNEWSE
jgi:hypothetical protein